MFEKKDYEIICGNSLSALKDLPSNSVQVCITSPPYYGLRDYGTGKWVGGDPNCPHKRITKYSPKTITGHAQEELRGNVGDAIYKKICPLCGAVRVDEQIGLEETPEDYIQNLVSIFREVKRILKDDGTLWVNIGDTYNASSYHKDEKTSGHGKQGTNRGVYENVVERPTVRNCKPKDLIGIPWMLAFALRNDGWYLRQDIIWHKPNPMPEAVKDRCTKSHEYIFLLSKKPNYYFDHDAIQEEAVTSEGRLPGVVRDRVFEYNSKRNNNPEAFLLGANDRKPHASDYKYLAGARTKNCQYDGQEPNTFHINRELGYDDPVYQVRNKRDVWSINISPYKGAHFATFPEKLVEPCVLAGSREGDIVLDPFNGSGTTGAVAMKYGRKYIGVELNPEYVKLTEKRFDELKGIKEIVNKQTGEVKRMQAVELF